MESLSCALTCLKPLWELSSGKSRAALTGQGHEWGDARRVQAPRVPKCDLGSCAGSRRCAHACDPCCVPGPACRWGILPGCKRSGAEAKSCPWGPRKALATGDERKAIAMENPKPFLPGLVMVSEVLAAGMGAAAHHLPRAACPSRARAQDPQQKVQCLQPTGSQRGWFIFVPGRTPCLLEKHLG